MSDATLDPADWEAARALGHRMIDDAVDYLRDVRERPVWSPIPEVILDTYQAPLPRDPMSTEDVYAEFQRSILPYPSGNIHPRFFSWVHGTGTFTGALADLMASVMNANCAIGEHSAMYIDRQVIGWCKEILDFPRDAGGLLVSGGSMANLTGLAVARQWAREAEPKKRLIAYGSSETHQCVTKAIHVLGLGAEGFCPIPVDRSFRIRLDLLREKIKADKNAGRKPFCIVANAGTVNTGAIDPLKDLAALAKKEGLWLHIDGAFGALARLSPTHAEALAPIALADSIAFDLHKWMYMPYEVGCVLIRDAALQRRTFAAPANYLLAHERGLASGPDAYANQGIELSRGFKALKVWMSLKEHGIRRYAQLIGQNIAQAAYLGRLVEQAPDLELLAEVTLNIVCFRYKGSDTLNKELLMRLQESGVAAPSYTMLHGCYALRVAITNHRTRMEDMDILIAKVLELGLQLSG
jgi:aromatic-L-amino-acid/L-tryptophan decarboxylase